MVGQYDVILHETIKSLIHLYFSVHRTGRRCTWEAGSRRSSVAVIAQYARKNEKRQKKYFGKSMGLKPQSRSAVHYLVSISDDYLKQGSTAARQLRLSQRPVWMV